MSSTMGNQSSVLSRASSIFKRHKKPLPIEMPFALPSPLPAWPSGGGFASGIIDLGGLHVCQVSTFTKVWSTQEGGWDNLGATFFEPSSIPDGFFMLGCYSQPNNKPLSGWILAAKDASEEVILKPPIDYTLVWSSESLKIKQEGTGYIWLPTPPDGYKAVGHVVTSSSDKPELDRVRCVRSEFTDTSENQAWIWGPGKEASSNEFNVFVSAPRDRGIQYKGVPTGTFVTQNNGATLDIPCLKNTSNNHNSMPDHDQINALLQAYSPVIYFHPNEQYLPSSVTWLFENGALLYKKGEESNPVPIDPKGSNLPQGGQNDDEYWIDLPKDNAEKERVEKGNLDNAEVYIHVKAMFGGTFTDIQTWIFYPFNGPGRAKVGLFNIPLGKIGQHIGDWEHVTLRISNFNGELKSMYLSQHSKGAWTDAVDLEFYKGNKPVAYSALSGHPNYPKPGLVMQGTKNIGIRNDTAKGKDSLDTGNKFSIVSVEYLGSAYVEPPWLNYMRKWGPKITYSTDEEIKKVGKWLPGGLKSALEKIVKSLPREVFYEDGPTGPKVKGFWSGDEGS